MLKGIPAGTSDRTARQANIKGISRGQEVGTQMIISLITQDGMQVAGPASR
jgi:hypothetical protein